MAEFLAFVRAQVLRGAAAFRDLFVPAAPHARAYWDGEMELTLAHLVRETETRASGRVQLISLASFRADIGELWDQYKDRILLIADTTIARRIGRGNTYIGQDEDSWLLLFSRLDETQAQERADEIAAVIGEKLVGSRFVMHEHPMPEADRLDLDDVVNEDGSINLEGVRAAVSRAKDMQVRAYHRKNTPAQPVPLRPAEPSRIRELAISYRPIWCAETQSIDTFALRANLGNESVLDDRGPALNEATAVDLVRAGLNFFRGMRRAGLRAKFILPIAASVLSTRALTDVQRLLTEVPRDERLLMLRLAFHRLPPRTGVEQLIALRELFRPYAREVAFLVDAFDPSQPAFALEHIVAIADVSGESDRSDAEFFEGMLIYKSRLAGRIACIVGVRKRSHLAKAVAAEIPEIGGSALGEEMRHLPERPQVLHREDLARLF